MKRIFILSVLVSAYTTITSPAIAVSKCVALTPNLLDTHCTWNSGSGTDQRNIDWSSNCTTNGITTPISGVAICSSQTGTATGTTSDTIETSATVADNHNCWCKMTSPAVSRWVFVYNSSNYFQCNQSCTSYCMSGLTQDFDFISAIFSNLTD